MSLLVASFIFHLGLDEQGWGEAKRLKVFVHGGDPSGVAAGHFPAVLAQKRSQLLTPQTPRSSTVQGHPRSLLCQRTLAGAGGMLYRSSLGRTRGTLA